MVRKYYIDNSFDRQKWETLVNEALGIADSVEFNPLFKKKAMPLEVEELESEVIYEGQCKDKVYPTGSVVRYRLSKQVIDFVWSKELSQWKNYPIQDISFLMDDIEFLATVSHEGYVILLLSENEKDARNEKGFHFDFEWRQ